MAQSLPKASQSDSKMEPFGAKVCFRKTAFGLRLCGPITCRPLPRSCPGHSKKASSRKHHQNACKNRLWAGIWGAMGPVGRTWRPKGGQWPPKCLPNASQIHRKLDSSVQPPPQTTKTTNWRPKGSKIEGRPASQSASGPRGKLAIVAAFTGQDRRCVRGPRGKIRDSGPLTHSLHRKNQGRMFFFSVPASLVPDFLPDFLLDFCSSLLACKHIPRPPRLQYPRILCTPHSPAVSR